MFLLPPHYLYIIEREGRAGQVGGWSWLPEPRYVVVGCKGTVVVVVVVAVVNEVGDQSE
jgi:hypothetical protein